MIGLKQYAGLERWFRQSRASAALEEDPVCTTWWFPTVFDSSFWDPTLFWLLRVPGILIMLIHTCRQMFIHIK